MKDDDGWLACAWALREAPVRGEASKTILTLTFAARTFGSLSQSASAADPERE